jgi:uncharacterized protein (DUF4415 family)
MTKNAGSTVRFTLDLKNATPLTEAQQAELEALETLPDEAIDYSDIPALTDEFWESATCSPLHKPLKQQLTVRVDSDVVAWLKAKGKGYQTRMNRILRSAMVNEIRKKAVFDQCRKRRAKPARTTPNS